MLHNPREVLAQYQNSGNLEARIALHQRFSTSTYDYHQWLFDFYPKQKARILELGVGSAKLWWSNSERIPKDWDITVSDFSEGMLSDARKGLAKIPHSFSLVQCDAQNIPFADHSFDVVIANHMLYHVPDVDRALAEVRRVLVPGGRFYAATGGLGHMKELDDFVEIHLSPKLSGVFVRLDSTTEHFALENGGEKVKRYFEHVECHLPPPSHLNVTEVEPFMSYILSMARWAALSANDSEKTIVEAIDQARRIAEGMLPIQITTSAGLFEAY